MCQRNIARITRSALKGHRLEDGLWHVHVLLVTWLIGMVMSPSGIVWWVFGSDEVWRDGMMMMVVLSIHHLANINISQLKENEIQDISSLPLKCL